MSPDFRARLAKHWRRVGVKLSLDTPNLVIIKVYIALRTSRISDGATCLDSRARFVEHRVGAKLPSDTLNLATLVQSVRRAQRTSRVSNGATCLDFRARLAKHRRSVGAKLPSTP